MYNAKYHVFYGIVSIKSISCQWTINLITQSKVRIYIDETNFDIIYLRHDNTKLI